jgi:hypothetical protein
VRLATLNLLNGMSLDDGAVLPERLAARSASCAPTSSGCRRWTAGQPRSHGADLTACVAEAMGAEHWRFVPALIGTPGGPGGLPPTTTRTRPLRRTASGWSRAGR